MGDAAAEELVRRAKAQEPLAKEELITRYRSQIAGIASGICGRHLDWDNDDELSISLMAFNEAIETFEQSKGKSFFSYARTVIHHRLVDYFRRESRFKYESLEVEDEEEEWNPYEVDEAIQRYRAEEEAREQEELVAEYDRALREFKITLDDLVLVSPRHRDTKAVLTRVAQAFVGEPLLLTRFWEHRQLPVKELMLLTGVSRKVLETGRKYIIAIVLIMMREEFAPLKRFIHFSGEGR